VLAAHRAGLKTMLIPMKNKKDMIDVPKKVLREMNFVYVERMDQVLPVALTRTRAVRRVAVRETAARGARVARGPA
jgi:ATP-dependent Lon protease